MYKDEKPKYVETEAQRDEETRQGHTFSKYVSGTEFTV